MEKIKYIYRDKKLFMGEPIKEKKIITQFLKNFKPNFATSGFIMDYVKNQKIEKHYNMGYEYNGFYWNEEDIYHFIKYNMPLNQDFIDYVISQKGQWDGSVR